MYVLDHLLSSLLDELTITDKHLNACEVALTIGSRGRASKTRKMRSGAALELDDPLVLILPVIFEAQGHAVPFVVCDELEIGMSDIHVEEAVLMGFACVTSSEVLSLRADVVELERVAAEDKIVIDVALLLVHILDALLAVADRAPWIEIAESDLIPGAIVLAYVVALRN
jgi:hypothetical protein